MEGKQTTVLIKIAQAMAECDGSVSEKEAKLIQDLPGKVGIKGQTDPGNGNTKTITDLASELDNHGDRCLAAKIGYMVAAISKNENDQSDINSDEKRTYRELISTLNLNPNEINEIEWAAKQEIEQGGTLIQLIKEALSAEGSWPDRELMGPEIPGL